LKISQANLPEAPEVVEKLDDEIAEPDATNGQLGDESEELWPLYEKLEHERLKVGLKIYEDMKIQDTAAFTTNLEIRTEDGSQKPAAACSSGSYPAVLDFPPLPKMVDQNLLKFHPLHMK
jgi:hypothetical protein